MLLPWTRWPHFPALCVETGTQAVHGACPVHGGDACLAAYAQVTAMQTWADQIAALWQEVTRDGSTMLYSDFRMKLDALLGVERDQQAR